MFRIFRPYVTHVEIVNPSGELAGPLLKIAIIEPFRTDSYVEDKLEIPFSVKTFLLGKRVAGIGKFCLINFNWERSCVDGFSVLAEVLTLSY
jgi:hypothetical protein